MILICIALNLADPIEVVVKDVLAVTKGDFTASAIRECVGRMFGSEQNYDKTDAVVKQLRIEVSACQYHKNCL